MKWKPLSSALGIEVSGVDVTTLSHTNDLVIWDNRATMQLAIQDYTADRYKHRSTVTAEQPTR